MLGFHTGKLYELNLKIGDRLLALEDKNGFHKDHVYTVDTKLKNIQNEETRFLKVNT